VRALTVRPQVRGSVTVEEVPAPRVDDGPVLVDTLAVGVCGTDLEIVAGEYGQVPPAKSG
jgi:D-arabinose 1-dehydrogenase-like Zn-dependent alcohol dehydrogenase